MVEGPPNWRTGKLCYIEIPAVDVARSAEFYHRAFGWELRQRGDGSTSFDDTVGEVSGTFVTGRPPATEPGLLVYIMVADLKAAIHAVESAGGKILHLAGPAAGEVFAWFADPAGNALGIYQQPGLAQMEAADQARPADDTAAEDRPAKDRSAEDRPAEDRPTEDRHPGDGQRAELL